MTLQRSQVIDFSESVIIDDLTALVPLEMTKDKGILIRPFHWRVWIGLLVLAPIFISALGLSDMVFKKKVKWWKLIDFALRSLCKGSGVTIPREQIHDKIFSIFWMYGSLVLFSAYSGESVGTR